DDGAATANGRTGVNGTATGWEGADAINTFTASKIKFPILAGATIYALPSPAKAINKDGTAPKPAKAVGIISQTLPNSEGNAGFSPPNKINAIAAVLPAKAGNAGGKAIDPISL